MTSLKKDLQELKTSLLRKTKNKEVKKYIRSLIKYTEVKEDNKVKSIFVFNNGDESGEVLISGSKDFVESIGISLLDQIYKALLLITYYNEKLGGESYEQDKQD